jgi:DNA-binding transcriptional LysR family regulator
MTLEQLRIFVAVAERQHMTRAPEALNLTQQAVSSAIVAPEMLTRSRCFTVGRGSSYIAVSARSASRSIATAWRTFLF